MSSILFQLDMIRQHIFSAMMGGENNFSHGPQLDEEQGDYKRQRFEEDEEETWESPGTLSQEME